MYPGRRNSNGIDLSDELALASLSTALRTSAAITWTAAADDGQGAKRPVVNPADHSDIVGIVFEASPAQARAAVSRAQNSQSGATAVEDRARMLDQAADAMQDRMPILLGLMS